MPPGSAEPVFPGVNSGKNQLLGATYDANGNVTALNTFGLSYDMENRLVSATAGSSTETYRYDASNHRVERITPYGADYVYFYGNRKDDDLAKSLASVEARDQTVAAIVALGNARVPLLLAWTFLQSTFGKANLERAWAETGLKQIDSHR